MHRNIKFQIYTMGNNQTKNELTPPHALYGQPGKLAIVNGEKFHSVSFPVQEEQRAKQFIRLFNTTQNFNKKHLLLSTNFQTESLFFCTKSKLLNCTFPFYPFSLQQEIVSRSEDKNYLSKEELLNLLYQVIDGARNFDRTEQKVGDIRPAQILLDESKKNIKLINIFTAPNQATGLEKCFENKKQIFLSPQQLKALQKNNPKPEINVHKADSFSLGLTILAIGNLKKLYDELYDLKSYSFSWTQLSNQLQIFQGRYGRFLTEIVKGFVQNQPRNRLYIGEIGAILQFYERHIFEMFSFEPDYLLIQKSYNLNYSGPRSEEFIKWLSVCREQVVDIKKVVIPVGIIESPQKVTNSKIRFQYTSPSTVKI